MTASRPATPGTNVRYNHQVNHQVNPSNNGLSKRTRGPINKRACQRCRQGKIKCDGDAETSKPCSNCDPQHCKYDNSPRKNKQVESLKIRLSTVEEQLVAITRDVTEKLNTKDLEKEILCLLYETKGHFINSNQALFQGLRDALKQSRCLRPILVITYELLMRLADDNNENYIPEIMKSLQRFVDCANTFEKDASILPTVPSSEDIFKKIENYCQTGAQPYSTNDNLIMPITTLPLQTLDNTQVHLNLPSGDESGSSTYEYDDVSSPPTPPKRQQQQQQQQVHSESKCYNGTNNVTHHIQNPQPSMIGTSSASDYSTTFAYGGENMYSYYPGNNEYVMDNNYLYLVNEAPTTTSPTDEQQMTSLYP